MDGLSLFLVCLTTFLVPLVLLASRSSVKDRLKEYLLFMLVLETGMIGVFLSLNLFLFYVFWEAALIPMYFLIGIFGGKRRIYATTKFVLYTMAGSLLMLVGIFVLQAAFARAYGTYSLNIFDFYRLTLPAGTQAWLFLAFGLAFAIKVPLFPFHTWLPDAHVEAPTGASVLLAAVLLKMGAYGFIRFAFPLFPDAVARFAPGSGHPGDHRHHLRRAHGPDSKRRQIARRLFERQPYGTDRSGPGRLEHDRTSGRAAPNAQSRLEHRNAVFRRRGPV